jgi:hypothetical protein
MVIAGAIFTVVAFIVILYVLRKAFYHWVGIGTVENTPSPLVTLEDLRGLRDRGELTSDEYEQARRKIIDKARVS